MFSTIKLSCAILALLTSSVSLAGSPLRLSSDVYVVQTKLDEDGRKFVTLEDPKIVLPGDNLVFIVRYRNIGRKEASDLTVTNPIPRDVRYAGSLDGLELVSVNGGRSWGFLFEQKVQEDDGFERPAKYADVTHVKWRLKHTLAPGQGGKIVFRGVAK